MIILLGPPGAGKSLQGRMLASAYGYKWISVGKLIRELGNSKYNADMATGNLVSSELTYDILNETFIHNDISKIILDGFPRLVEQTDWLINSQYLDKINLVLIFDVSKNEGLKRLRLRSRADDTERTVNERRALYDKTIKGIEQRLVSAGINVAHIDGEGDVNQVFDRVSAVIKKGDF